MNHSPRNVLLVLLGVARLGGLTWRLRPEPCGFRRPRRPISSYPSG
jgi:hypothetical protein